MFESRTLTAQERVVLSLGVHVDAPPSWAAIKGLVERGLPAGSFRSVAVTYGLSNRRLAQLAQIPARTIDRRIAGEQRLRIDESDRLTRVVRVFAAAEELFEDRIAVERWLSTPNRALDGAKPIDELTTDLGAREVEELLARVTDGVFA